MATFSLDEIRAVRKAKDAWWTVLLVDPLAIRLTWLLARTRITPDQITVAAFALGIGAAACFWQATPGWLALGALLYHLGFILDCCDGKIARLKELGSPFGGWLDFMLDRVRDAVCAIALAGGMYAATGQAAYLWMGFAILGLDMFRYLNSAQISKARRSMRAETAKVRQAAEQAADIVLRPADAQAGAGGEHQGEPAPAASRSSPAAPLPRRSRYRRVRAVLLKRRIRMHLISGIEFQMAAFIVGPLTGFIIPAVAITGGMLMLFEMALIARFYRTSRSFAAGRRVRAAMLATAAGHPADPVAVRVTT